MGTRVLVPHVRGRFHSYLSAAYIATPPVLTEFPRIKILVYFTRSFYVLSRIFILRWYKVQRAQALGCSLRGSGTPVEPLYADSWRWVPEKTILLDSS
jgi:hypothetical protein